MSFFTSFPDHQVLESLQEKFLKDLDVTGAESFLMTDEAKGAQGIGIEDVQAYLDNFKWFGKLLEGKERLKSEWEKIEIILDQLEKKIYSSEFLSFRELKKKYDEGKLNLDQYVDSLGELYKMKLGQTLGELYPQISQMQSAKKITLSINQKEVEKEYFEFVQALQKKLVQEDFKEVVKNILNYRSEKINVEEHYLFLSQYLEPGQEERVSPLKVRRVGGVMEEINNPTDSPYLKGREKQEDKELYPNLKLLFQQMALTKDLSWEKLKEERKIIRS
ncbi:MAG: hypothetical protein HYS07_01335 [Chlamydiae bacterium]|nr:hypothetical protein [Chlamydiota bacterium]MBI3276954.1 hypothetical protein [Chlamydiota bacterium]